MTREIVILSNDVIPGMGVPVAAPGLRAWGLAQGLRAHGHPVTVVVNEAVVRRVWHRPVPPPLPRSTRILPPARVGDLVRTRRPAAVVTINSNHVAALGDLGDSALVYDFFAPKVLELAQARPGSDHAAVRARLVESKLAALRSSQAVIVNGAKKMPYARDWMARAGVADDVPTTVVNMPLPPTTSHPPTDGPIHAVVSGYIQPWSLPGRWTEAVGPYLDDGSMVLHLLVNNHWGGERGRDPLPAAFEGLLRHPGVVRHGTMEFGDFRRFLAGCHLSIDLFGRNPERELAMVTRTAVSLSCGLPVLHVPFTETSAFVADHDAGWLVEADDFDGIRAALDEAITQPDVLAAKRAGAEQVGREVLDPEVATAPLHALLEGRR